MADNKLDSFFVTGLWKSEFNRLDEDILDDAMAEPWRAMKTLWDPDCREKLQDAFGVNRAYFFSKIRVVAQDICARARSESGLNEYEVSLVLLAIESLLIPRGDAVFPVANEATRREWVRDFCPPRGSQGESVASPKFEGIQRIRPELILRLVTERQALSRPRGALRGALVHAILGAAEKRLSGDWDLIGLQVRLMAIRLWIVTNEGEDAQGSVRRMLAAVGLDVESLRRMIEELRSEGSIADLAKPLDSSIELADAFEYEEFCEARDYFNFELDAESVKLQGLLTERRKDVRDYWVRSVYAVALRSGEFQAEALRILGSQVEEGSEPRRAAMDLILENQILSPSEFSSILDDELDDQAGSFSSRIFRCLLETWMSKDIRAFDQCVEQSGLKTWIIATLEDYRDGPTPVIVRELDDDLMAGINRGIEAWKELPPLDRFVDEYVEAASNRSMVVSRQEADADGVLWFFDYLVSIRDSRTPDDYDQGRKILIDDDRRFVRQTLVDFLAQKNGWWRASMDSARQLRLLEAATRAGVGDLSALTIAVARVIEKIKNLTTGLNPERLDLELARCRQVVLVGHGKVNNRLLDSFRRSDPAGFQEHIDPPPVEIPLIRRKTRVFGFRAGIYMLLIAIVGVALLIRYEFFVPTSGPEVSVAVGDLEALLEKGATPKELRWIAAEPGVWIYTMTSADLEKFFGKTLRGKSSRPNPDSVEFDLGEEFLRRYETWVQGEHPGGLRAESDAKYCVAWENITLRLPAAEDPDDYFASSVATSPVWLGDRSLRGASSFTDPPMRAGLHVVIKRK